jgi:hypothetical protein
LYRRCDRRGKKPKHQFPNPKQLQNSKFFIQYSAVLNRETTYRRGCSVAQSFFLTTLVTLVKSIVNIVVKKELET